MMTTETDFIATSPTSTTDLSAVPPHKMTTNDRMSYRKTTKPMMEKKRRARINHCLGQLKSLVLQAMKKDNSQYSKLEKADILELTVKHLKNVQRIQANANSATNQIPTEAFNKYRAGFNECANEVVRYLGENQGLNNEARTRILSHLSNILSPVNSLSLQQQTSSAQIVPSPARIIPGHAPILPAPPTSSPHQLHHHHQQQQQQLHNLNLQLQQQSNINNALSLLQQQQQQQQQQELSRDINHNITTSPLHNDIQQCHQQQQININSSNGFHNGLHRQNLSVPDLNNNSVVNVNNNNNSDNVINRNMANTSNCHSGIDNSSGHYTSSAPISRNQSFRKNVSPNLIDSNSNQIRDFKPLIGNANSAQPSAFQLPCITTPTSMTTAATPFQLVHSTLPNGQIALVLAPTITQQPLPAAINMQSSLMPVDMSVMAVTETPNQSIIPNQERSPIKVLSQHRHPQASISPTSHFVCQDKPIPLVVSKSHEPQIVDNSLNTLKPNSEHSRVHHEHLSAPRHPASSSYQPSPPPSSPATAQSLSSSSPSTSVSSSINTSYNTNLCLKSEHPRQNQSQQSSRVGLSSSPPRINDLRIADNDSYSDNGHFDTRTSMSREVVRCPEDVTSKRDLFEYKMAKSRSRSKSQEESVGKGIVGNDAKNTWRPW